MRLRNRSRVKLAMKTVLALLDLYAQIIFYAQDVAKYGKCFINVVRSDHLFLFLKYIFFKSILVWQPMFTTDL